MPKCLKKVASNDLYHRVGGEKVNGKTPKMTGDCTGLTGDCTGLRGDLDEITEDEREEFSDIEHWVEE